MNNRISHDIKEDSVLKRSNDAPSFSTSLVRNRNQLLIEMYIQRNNINIAEYIQSQRYLRLDIPIETLRGWYPTPNWKKDIEKLCKNMQNFHTNLNFKNGDFQYMTLLFNMKLDSAGLHLSINPEALQYYVITNNNSLLYYDTTKHFKISYSYELFWEACKHDTSTHNFSFYLTPETINSKYETNYRSNGIGVKILEPSIKEIKTAYDKGLSPIYITYEERREVKGKAKTIVGWEFFIHNVNREKDQDQSAIEAYGKIFTFLEKHYNKYHLNVIEQVRSFDSKQLLSLWLRLEQIEMQLDQIVDIQKYLSKVLLDGFKITPQRKPSGKKEISDSPLFSQIEKDNKEGVDRWVNALSYVKNGEFPDEFKSLFKELNIYEYVITDMMSNLTLICPQSVKSALTIVYPQQFQEVLSVSFPAKIRLVIKERKI